MKKMPKRWGFTVGDKFTLIYENRNSTNATFKNWRRGDILTVVGTDEGYPDFKVAGKPGSISLILRDKQGNPTMEPYVETLVEDEPKDVKYDVSRHARVFNMEDMEEYASQRVNEVIAKILKDM